MRFFNKLRDNRKASIAVVIALVVGLISVAIILPVGLFITSSLKTTVDAMDLGAAGNTTRTNLFANIYAAYNLSVIIPIIAAAGLIIGAIGVYFAFRRG
jgi:hypothetical protein